MLPLQIFPHLLFWKTIVTEGRNLSDRSIERSKISFTQACKGLSLLRGSMHLCVGSPIHVILECKDIVTGPIMTSVCVPNADGVNSWTRKDVLNGTSGFICIPLDLNGTAGMWMHGKSVCVVRAKTAFCMDKPK